jgi:hypothetical protein
MTTFIYCKECNKLYNKELGCSTCELQLYTEELRLSAKLVGWALEQEGLEPQEKLLLVILADHFNDKEGAAWAGQARIAKMMGVSDRQVRRLQVSLVDQRTTTCRTKSRSIKHVSEW